MCSSEFQVILRSHNVIVDLCHRLVNVMEVLLLKLGIELAGKCRVAMCSVAMVSLTKCLSRMRCLSCEPSSLIVLGSQASAQASSRLTTLLRLKVNKVLIDEQGLCIIMLRKSKLLGAICLSIRCLAAIRWRREHPVDAQRLF